MQFWISAFIASLFTQPALAAFGTLERQAVEQLIGTDGTVAVCTGGSGGANQATCEAGGGVWTAGTEATAVYEIAAIVEVGLVVAMGVVIAFTGYGLAKNVVRMVRAR